MKHVLDEPLEDEVARVQEDADDHARDQHDHNALDQLRLGGPFDLPDSAIRRALPRSGDVEHQLFSIPHPRSMPHSRTWSRAPLAQRARGESGHHHGRHRPRGGDPRCPAPPASSEDSARARLVEATRILDRRRSTAGACSRGAASRWCGRGDVTASAYCVETSADGRSWHASGPYGAKPQAAGLSAVSGVCGGPGAVEVGREPLQNPGRVERPAAVRPAARARSLRCGVHRQPRLGRVVAVVPCRSAR